MHQTCTNNLSQKPVQTTYQNNLTHQSYQPNQIYSPRSITKTTLKDVYQPTITRQLIISPRSICAYNNIPIQVCYIIHKPCVNNTTNKCLQPCTKYVPIMYQLLINYDSSICTNIINYTPHVCSNSSTTCLNHVPNIYLNQNPSSISSSKSDL
jgi:hypothetical protein